MYFSASPSALQRIDAFLVACLFRPVSLFEVPVLRGLGVVPCQWTKRSKCACELFSFRKCLLWRSYYFNLLETSLGTTYTSPLVSSLRILLSFPNSGKPRDQNLILEDFQLRLYTDPLFEMSVVFLSWLDSPSGPSPPLRSSAFTLGRTLDEWSACRRDTTLTRDRHPCCRRDSNLQSQQAYTHALDVAVDWM